MGFSAVSSSAMISIGAGLWGARHAHSFQCGESSSAMISIECVGLGAHGIEVSVR